MVRIPWTFLNQTNEFQTPFEKTKTKNKQKTNKKQKVKKFCVKRDFHRESNKIQKNHVIVKKFLCTKKPDGLKCTNFYEVESKF